LFGYEEPRTGQRAVLEALPLLGLRQTRFTESEYKLTVEDASEGGLFDDVDATSSCAIIHLC
jgi:hypothetical protein